MSMSSLYLASRKSTWDFLNVLFGQIARMIVQDLGRAVSPRAHWVLFWLKNRRFNASVEINKKCHRWHINYLEPLCLHVYFITSKRRSWNVFQNSHSVLFQILLFCQMWFLDFGFRFNIPMVPTATSLIQSCRVGIVSGSSCLTWVGDRDPPVRAAACDASTAPGVSCGCRLPARLIPYLHHSTFYVELCRTQSCVTGRCMKIIHQHDPFVLVLLGCLFTTA